MGWLRNLKESFIFNFVDDAQWRFLFDGLLVTLQITIFAVLLGLMIGFLIALVRTTHDKTINTGKKGGLGKVLLRIGNFLGNLYLTVIRGTPVTLQLLIIYFVIFASVNIDKTFVAVIAFGINSGAYVAEIFRSGIMSVDSGQFEAGRSLGFNYVQTMIHIIMPQAVKNVLPAICNELIVLLKETSVVNFIGLNDLTRGANIIRSLTYDAFMPLIAAALIYLLVVIILSKGVKFLERRLRASER